MIRSNIALAVFLLLSGCSDALTIPGGRSVRSSFVRQSVMLAAEPKKNEIDIAAVQKEADDALKAAEAALSKGNNDKPPTPPTPPRPVQLDPKVVAATKAFQKAAAEFQVEAVAAAVGAAAVGGTLGLTLLVQYPSITASVDPSVPPLAGATLLAGSALAVGLQDSQPGRIVRNVLGKPTKAIGTGIAKSIKNSIDRTVDRVVSFPGYVAEETKKKVTTTVQEIESDIKAFPKKVSEAALDAAEDLKEEIIATPGRIVEGTKESVRKTVEGTKQAVQQKTKETQEKIVKSVEEVVAIPTKTVESIASLLEGGEKRDPEVPKPPKLPPPEEAIRQGSNQVQLPRLAVPKLSTSPAPPKVQPPAPKAAPKLDAPKIEIPKVEIPKIEIPKVEIPKVEIPKVEVPRVDLPKLDLPKVKAPEETKPVAKKPAKKKKSVNEGAQVTASVKALMAELSAEKVTPAVAKTDNTVAERRRAEEQAEKARLEQKQKQEQLNAQKAAERAKAAEQQRQQQEERKRQQEAQQAEKARLAMEQKQRQEQAIAQKAAERAKALELQRQKQEERRRQQEAKQAETEAKRAAQQARQEEQNRKAEQQRAEQAEKRRAAAEAARLEAERRQQEQARLREEKLKASQQKEKPQAVATAPRPSFLLGTSSQRASAAAPRGVPTIAYWRKRADNGISGKIYGSPNFKDGERVETSAITFGQIENGYVVKTSSGSRYFLSSTPPAPGKAEKALESAKPGATINLSNIFSGSANDAQAQKAKPRSTQASPQPSTTFSLFGSSGTVTVTPPKKESVSKSVSVKADSPPRATFSLFGLGQADPESAPTVSKVTKSKPRAPRGVPTLKNWRKNGDKSVTGNISGSPNFKENEKVTTSPIVKGNIAAGEVVTTGSGSRYFLN
ncbi:hypothetical protein FisN_24Hh190 [Fistulifera solaris]|uniref:Uncharacterized protein n=1 Tax=Fistulifera solaris TaxID=1519565 RepID=A0A1Z5JUM1_FISSO|nr:hypothetical protein FisN_24Hh190 [Fistulifera solaris]|eukprot:GAX17744.1 hypothetical protein FisN_24Hh190 [Fistulifera solaris]